MKETKHKQKVFEITVQRKIFGLKESISGRICTMICKLHQIGFVIKSNKIRWAGHVVRVGRSADDRGVSWEILKQRDHIENLIFKWLLERWDERK
jgi:hypothetical protein